VSGVVSRQVFQRDKAHSGPVVLSFTGNHAVLNAALRGPDADLQRSSELPAGTIVFPDVPVGGPYTLTAGGEQFSDLYVGELWIVSGQSNAFGYSYDADATTRKGPMPGVHYFGRYGTAHKVCPMTGDRDEQMEGWREWVAGFTWMEAQDPLFWRNRQNNGPWVTAAQEYYTGTGVPVGLMGHAQGGRPMKYFLSMDEREMRFLRPIVEWAGRGAARFLWYQGEGDAYVRYNPYYRARFRSMVEAMRRYTGNDELVIGVVQLSKFQNVYAKDRVGLFRNAYAEMRELQRNLVLETHNAVLFSTATADVKNAGVHLTARSQVRLGEQIAHVFARHERTGELRPAGPQPQSVVFGDDARTAIIVQFSGDADALTGGETPEQWAVYDAGHPPGIDGWFTVNGVDETGRKQSRPFPNGYPDMTADRKLNNVVRPGVPIRAVRLDPDRRQVRIELGQPAGEDSTLSYAYISHILGDLRNGAGYPAPGFTYVPIPSSELDSRPRDAGTWLVPPDGPSID
jgi:hypothetical protein